MIPAYGLASKSGESRKDNQPLRVFIAISCLLEIPIRDKTIFERNFLGTDQVRRVGDTGCKQR